MLHVGTALLQAGKFIFHELVVRSNFLSLGASGRLDCYYRFNTIIPNII